MDASAMIAAGKVPRHLLPWKSGPRLNACEFDGHAFLFDVNIGALHLVDRPITGYGGYTVMDDSDIELRRHLQAVRAAQGRVLKTGLGMGCFVRMCLQKPDVEHIDVIEIDRGIIEHFGAEFRDENRVTIWHGDALTFPVEDRKWDFGWHDIYCECNDGLAEMHAQLIIKFHDACREQGAWNFPREFKRAYRLAA